MEPIGPKIAEGRDSEIYEHGTDRVLRLARNGRSLEGEARTMEYARAQGYPCPAVHDAGDGYLVMDHLDGPTMMEASGRPPFPLRRVGRMLADLHERLHRLAAPDWVDVAPLTGDRLLHRDLHPLNVILTEDGPMVIDWANASAGDPAFDVADTWALFACATAPASGLDRVVIPIGRRVMLRAFLAGVDRDAARRAIPAAAAHRLTDQNMSPEERERLLRFAERSARG